MIKKRIAITTLLICLCFQCMAYCVLADNTADAVEPIVPDRTASLTLSYGYADTAFSSLEVDLYRIAEVSFDFQYTLTATFAPTGLILNGIQSTGEWNVIRSTLEAYIVANQLPSDAVCLTKEDGTAAFDNLKTGLYLAVAEKAVQGELSCDFDSALVALPGLSRDGYWEYQVTANAKGEPTHRSSPTPR